MDIRFHAETGCRKIYSWKVFEGQKKSVDAKETISDGCGRNYVLLCRQIIS